MDSVVNTAVGAASTADRSARSLWKFSLARRLMEIRCVEDGFEGQWSECRMEKAGEKAMEQSVERPCNNRGS
jgi:hypothetical protein